MKSYKLLTLLLCTMALPCFADSMVALDSMAGGSIVTATSSVDQEYYGKVDAIYPGESALIINDTSLTYTKRSQFFGQRGQRINNLNNLKRGTLVKYHLSKGIAFPGLKDLRIMSIDDYERLQKMMQDDE